MIGILAVFIAFTVLTIEYYVSRKSKTETVCTVWVQKNWSSEWICVERSK